MPTLPRPLAAVAATGLAAAGLLSAAPAHAATGSGVFVIKVNEVQTHYSQSWNRRDLPRAGDHFSFTSDLRQHGTRVGTDTGACTFRKIYGAANNPSSAKVRCDVTFTFFQRGNIEAAGTRTIAWDRLINNDFTVTIPVVGGTNHYRDAAGTVRNQQVSETRSRLTFELTGVSS